MIKAIIFDFFGVLYGSAYQNTFAKIGGESAPDYSEIKPLMDKANLGLISRDEFAEAAANKLGLQTKEYKKLLKEAENINQELLDYIAGELYGKYRLAILSNANVGSIQSRLPKDLLKMFDHLVVSAEVGYAKPDDRIFELALSKLEVQPEEAVFIDDLEGFVAAAKDLGINGIHYKNFQDFKKRLDHLLHQS